MYFKELISIEMDKVLRTISNPHFCFPRNVFCFLLKYIFVFKSSKEHYVGSAVRLFQLTLNFSHSYFAPFTC